MQKLQYWDVIVIEIFSQTDVNGIFGPKAIIWTIVWHICNLLDIFVYSSQKALWFVSPVKTSPYHSKMY